MTRRFFIIATVVLFSAVGVFSSCNDDDDEPDYSTLILGQWLHIDVNNTNESYAISITNDKKVTFSYALEESAEVGYTWYTSPKLAFSLNGSFIEVTGEMEPGIELYNKVRINSLDEQTYNFTSLEYSLNGEIDHSEDNLTYIMKKTSDTSSEVVGAWKGTEIGSEEVIFYYLFKANHTMDYYELEEDGSWTHYPYEKYYCYSDFMAMLWKETTDESDPNVYAGYVMEKENDDALIFTNKKEGVVNDAFILYRIDKTELPGQE